MSTKVSKAEFDALPESLKTKFKAEGDEYALVEEDVEGLKKSKAEILQEKKDLQARLDAAEQFRKDHEAKVAEADEEKLKAAGQFKELETKLREKIVEVETDRDKQLGDLKSVIKAEKVKNFLVEKGVLPDRVGYALSDTLEQFDIESGEQGFTLKLKNGIGDAKELDGAVEALKTKAAFLFPANGASGSGASGSQNNGGGAGKSITRAQYDANPVSYGQQLAKGELTITD